ncbi:ATP-binding protein [Microcoleus sp. FACHB-68]|uniref:ATP-binding protein n=1 Tax=Microcoleus sp. FACHB-68 TaxID=2692826 RepID=UPI0016897E63|nr:ATP-binding protein [Microcoleus sp. FACHB-68]MBD1937189.1 ATP-binding protein [Microcoleus sp. FACHB-68]
MACDFISPIKALNTVIATHNPFNKQPAVKDSEIWSLIFPDISTLNDHASDAVFQAIEQARTGQSKIISMAISGESGTGKSHLIHRIRHRLQIQGSGLFIYANAHQFNEVNLIRYQFLQLLVDSLRRQGNQGVLQCQQLATVMVNEALKALTPMAKAFTPIELVRKLAGNSHAKNQNWVNQLTEAFFKTQPDVPEPDIVRALVWTLCNAQAPFAVKWLAGKSLAPWKADELGLPNHSREERESAAWDTVVQILNLMSDYYPLIICFDDLDSPESSENNLKRERVVASLIRRLWDSLQMTRLNHGVVILSTMTPATWTEKILTLPAGLATYFSGKKEVIELNSITGDKIVELVSDWLQIFYTSKNLIPPTPVYPFDSGQLQSLGREKLTVRQVLEWCEENFRPVELDPLEKVEQAFEQAMSIELGDELSNNFLLAEAINFSFQTLIGQSVEGVKIEAVAGEVKPKSANQEYIQFKITGTQNENAVKIGVAVLQDTRAQSVAAGVKRLTQYGTFDLSCGCLVRAFKREIPPHWQAYNYLTQLTVELGGKWVNLKLEDIKPLIAIWSLHRHRQADQFSEAEIFEFIAQRRLAADNPLIRGIVRGKTPQIPVEVVAEAETNEAIITEELEPADQRDLMRDFTKS